MNLTCEFFITFPEIALNRARIFVNVEDYQFGRSYLRDLYLGITAFSVPRNGSYFDFGDTIYSYQQSLKMLNQYSKKPKKAKILNEDPVFLKLDELGTRQLLLSKIFDYSYLFEKVRFDYLEAVNRTPVVDYICEASQAGYDENLERFLSIISDTVPNFLVISLYDDVISVYVSTPNTIRNNIIDSKQGFVRPKLKYSRFILLQVDRFIDGKDFCMEDAYRMAYAVSRINNIPILILNDGIVYTEYFYEQLRKMNKKKFDKAFRKSVILSL